jgi:hypothetical protein
MNFRTQEIMPRHSEMAAALLLLAGACAGSTTPPNTVTPAPAKELSSVATDTTVRVQQDSFELSLWLSPIPRRIGESASLEVSVRNTGSTARGIVVSPCHLYTRGVRALPEIECQVGAGPITLQPGGTWSKSSNPTFYGPPGRHRFEVEAIPQALDLGWPRLGTGL